jgi:hypothetical protein
MKEQGDAVFKYFDSAMKLQRTPIGKMLPPSTRRNNQ